MKQRHMKSIQKRKELNAMLSFRRVLPRGLKDFSLTAAAVVVIVVVVTLSLIHRNVCARACLHPYACAAYTNTNRQTPILIRFFDQLIQTRSRTRKHTQVEKAITCCVYTDRWRTAEQQIKQQQQQKMTTKHLCDASFTAQYPHTLVHPYTN